MKVQEESEKVGLKLNIQKTKIVASGPVTSWKIDGETVETVADIILGGSKITADGNCSQEIKRCLLLGRKVMTKLDSILKSRNITFSTSQGYSFFSSHVWMWELDHKESWVLKNWCFWTVVLEKTLESPLDCMEIQPVHPKGNQSWVFIGRTDVEAETPILWPPHANSWLMEKTFMLGKIEGRRRRQWQTMRWLVASPTQWTWVCANSGSWWWTGRLGVLQFMGSQKFRYNWATELNWAEVLVSNIVVAVV